MNRAAARERESRPASRAAITKNTCGRSDTSIDEAPERERVGVARFRADHEQRQRSGASGR